MSMESQRNRPVPPVFVPALLLLCLCLALGGCFKKTIGAGDPGRPVTPPAPAAAGAFPVSADGAEAAFRAGDMARAEQIATQITAGPGLPRPDAARAFRVLALSAVANRHAYLGAAALDRWREADPGADAGKEWQDAFFAAMSQFPEYEAADRIKAVHADEARPFSLRAAALLRLSARQWERGPAQNSLAALAALYAGAPDKNQKIAMEYALFDALHNASAGALAALSGQVTAENSKKYPHALVRLEEIRRAGLAPGGREAAQTQAEALREGTALADPGLFAAWGAATSAATASPVIPLAGKTVVMALPLSGQLEKIGTKIARGAEVARKGFEASGHTVGLVLLDTSKADWLDKLAALPPSLAVVGGPLRAQDFAAAQARGLTSGRVFLTFMPTLGSGAEEGRTAWRFFPSPDDQMAALFRLTQELGVGSYAILMPDGDPYAERMANLFEQQAASRGARIAARAKYPSKAPDTWNKFVGSFLGTSKNAEHAPAVSYQAIFLPDSWKNMELIVPNLFYFRETRQVLLGTSLWEPGLTNNDHIDARYYGMGVFPGSWNPGIPTPAAESLQAAFVRGGYGEPDFWAGLGYDFVRFAATLDIPQGWTPDTVNAALSGHADMSWSTAPIVWSGRGAGSQQMHLFTPASTGFVPVNVGDVKARFDKAWKR